MSLTQPVAVDDAAEGVRVGCLDPASIGTPLGGGDRFPPYTRWRTPLDRAGVTAEGSPPAPFPTSEGSSCIAGANIRVDGRWPAV